ncbi:MAG TPA: glycosyltransferase family 2 protein [Ignavibacteria bacterium]|nr:glycosyltransferase family 2 protein [Ignavibacteria bacterium]
MITSIIIVNYKSAGVLQECIKSIAEFETISDLEIIIVDNNSGDDSESIMTGLSNSYPQVKTIFLEDNRGFSYANNAGYEISSGEYIVIMNPDIVLTENILTKLREDLDNIELGAVCPLLIGTDGKFQRNYFQRYPSLMQFIMFHSVFAKLFNWSSFLMNRYLEDQDINVDSGGIEFVAQIPGAFCMMRRRVFEDAGKMDEKYKLFFEDVDLSYQINKKYKLGVDTTKRVTHLGGTSFKTEDNWWLYGRYTVSMVYFFKKNYGDFRTGLLKVATKMNSYLIILMEQLSGKKNSYRYKKHKYFIEELKKDPALN